MKSYTVFEDADEVFKVAELVSSGWHLLYAEIPYERVESVMTWCSAAGEDVTIIREYADYDGEEDEEDDEFGATLDYTGIKIRHVVLIRDKLRAAQFSLEFL